MKAFMIAAVLVLACAAEAMAQGYSYSYRYRPSFQPPRTHSWSYTAPGGGYYYGNSYNYGRSTQHYGYGPRGSGFSGNTYYQPNGSSYTNIYGW